MVLVHVHSLYLQRLTIEYESAIFVKHHLTYAHFHTLCIYGISLVVDNLGYEGIEIRLKIRFYS